jgi:hypothetical protein
MMVGAKEKIEEKVMHRFLIVIEKANGNYSAFLFH